MFLYRCFTFIHREKNVTGFYMVNVAQCEKKSKLKIVSAFNVM